MLLILNVATTSEIPEDRWKSSGYHFAGEQSRNASATSKANFLHQNVAAFDADFFHIGQAEATGINPQQRMLLEVAFETFENSGIPIDKLAESRTGCYVGGFTSDWREMQFRDI